MDWHFDGGRRQVPPVHSTSIHSPKATWRASGRLNHSFKGSCTVLDGSKLMHPGEGKSPMGRGGEMNQKSKQVYCDWKSDSKREGRESTQIPSSNQTEGRKKGEKSCKKRQEGSDACK